MHFMGAYAPEAAVHLVTDLIGVSPKTVQRWAKGENPPMGVSLLKLRVLLDAAGYQVKEFIELPEVTRQFMQLIAFDLVTLDGARDILVYKNTTDILDVVLRGRGIYPDKQYRMATLVEHSQEELAMARDEWQTRLTGLLPTGTGAESTPPPVPPASSSDEPPGIIPEAPTSAPAEDVDDETALQVLAHLLQGSLGLLGSINRSHDAAALRRTLLIMVGRDRLDLLHRELQQLLAS
jgi:hypothetical protein